MKRTFMLMSICLAIVIAAVSGIVGFSIGSNTNIGTAPEGAVSIQDENGVEEDIPAQEDVNTNIETDLVTNAIMNEETALKVGRAILEEHFPDIMLTDDEPLEARERNGVWRVETTYEKSGVDEDGRPWDAFGESWYVEFSKMNGEIFYIGRAREPDEHTVIAPTVPMVFDFAELSGYGFPQGNWSINQLIDKYGTPEIKMESYWNEQWYEAVAIEAIYQGMTVRFRPLIDSGFSFYNVGEPIQNINLEEFDLTENDKNIETKVFNLTLHKENQGFIYGIKIGQSTKAEVIAVYPEGTALIYKMVAGRVDLTNDVSFFYDFRDENGNLPEPDLPDLPGLFSYGQVTYCFDHDDVLESIRISWPPEDMEGQ